MKKSPLTPETTDAILDAAWTMVVAAGRLDVSLGAIAGKAGVTRQSVYLAFGNRAGLLTAMARRADSKSLHTVRMAQIADGSGDDPATLGAFAEAWLSHLPEIYPVGRLLGAAAATDPEAAAAFRDRMIGGLHTKYTTILSRLSAAGHLAPGLTVARAADLAWSLTHLDAWTHLVTVLGWTPEAFRADRLAILGRVLLRQPLPDRVSRRS